MSRAPAEQAAAPREGGALAADLRQWLRQADELRHRHPRRALLRARALRDLAATLEPAKLRHAALRRDTVGPDPATEPGMPADDPDWLGLQSSAWSVLAGAHRQVGERAEAEGALAVALAFARCLPLPTGENGSPERDLAFARLALRMARLRHDQGRHREALALDDDAIRLSDRHGEHGLAARARVDRAIVLHACGRTRRAIPLLCHVLEHLDLRALPRVHARAVHALGFYLVLEARSDDEHREAVRWLQLATSLPRELAAEPDLLRLRAAAALLTLGHGHDFARARAAAVALASCREGFARLGSKAERASSLLCRIARELGQGRRSEARAHAAQLLRIAHHLALPEPAPQVLARLLDDSPGATGIEAEGPGGVEEADPSALDPKPLVARL